MWCFSRIRFRFENEFLKYLHNVEFSRPLQFSQYGYSTSNWSMFFIYSCSLIRARRLALEIYAIIRILSLKSFKPGRRWPYVDDHFIISPHWKNARKTFSDFDFWYIFVCPLISALHLVSNRNTPVGVDVLV